MVFWEKLFGKGNKKNRERKEKNETQNKANSIIENYIAGLKKAYLQNNAIEEWTNFEKVIHGAKKGNIKKLRNVYPEVPNALIELLQYVDGTYWRKYKDDKITFFILGSDISEYPYYLLSSKRMVENRHNAREYFSDYIDRKYDGVDMDEKITAKSESVNWLHFSDCMNNGGTSSLFIDFSPSEKGKRGQVVRFLHDPDEFKVIAEGFEDYLKILIETEYDFINEETVEG